MVDHSIDAVIAANDAFTIFFMEQVASTDHKEAISLHKEAGKKISGFFATHPPVEERVKALVG